MIVPAVSAGRSAGERIHFQLAMHVDREFLLDRVGLFVGQGLHPDDGLALLGHLHPPIDAHLAASGHLDLLHGIAQRHEFVVAQFQGHLNLLLGFQIVLDIGRQHHFILLDEESRGLQPDDEVLAGDDFGLALPHFGSMAQAPDFDFPGRQILRHRERHLGLALLVRRQRTDPQSRVGKIRAQFGCTRGGAGTGFGLLPLLVRFQTERAGGVFKRMSLLASASIGAGAAAPSASSPARSA